MPIPGGYKLFHPKLGPQLLSSGHFPDTFSVERRNDTVDSDFNASGAWVNQLALAGQGLWGRPADQDVQAGQEREQIVEAAVISLVGGIIPGDRMLMRGTKWIVVDAMQDRVWYKYLLRKETAGGG